MIMNHRHSIRFQKLDYSLPNKFFVTICALKHGSYFEKYPELTEIVRDEIIEIQKYFPNINITNSVIMPNHMHLIISINKKVKGVTLGKIINVFKGRTINKWLKTIQKNKINEIACIWQRNYFEHRVRNSNELIKYQKYIKLNPIRWQQDRYNPLNLKCKGFASRSPKFF
ncbi:MAG: transposase [Candidatus Shapirobacteria bacterium]|nr:transposase [Candidatus Woesebacteria bacterium]